MTISVELEQIFAVTDDREAKNIANFDNYVRSLTINGKIYELYQSCNKYKAERNYHSVDECNIYGMNKVLIIFPLEAYVVLCPMNIAIELSGITLYLKYSNPIKYPVKQYTLYNKAVGTNMLSPTIIVTELPSQSVICPVIIDPSGNNSSESVTTIHSLIHNY